MSLCKYFLKVAYCGTQYAGWQRQKNAQSIQAVLEHALSLILSESITIYGSSRTDRGVHAEGQIAHFSTFRKIVPKRMLHSLNAVLPSDISALDLQVVPDTAHARYDAIRRCYIYFIHRQKHPFLFGRSLFYPYTLNLEAMNQAAHSLFLHKDFHMFSKTGSSPLHTLCTIYQAHWHMEQSQILFTISANRFLRGMVRALVGTFLKIGRGHLQSTDMHNILQGTTTLRAAFAPPEGLHLVHVHYPHFSIEKQV